MTVIVFPLYNQCLSPLILTVLYISERLQCSILTFHKIVRNIDIQIIFGQFSFFTCIYMVRFT